MDVVGGTHWSHFAGTEHATDCSGAETVAEKFSVMGRLGEEAPPAPGASEQQGALRSERLQHLSQFVACRVWVPDMELGGFADGRQACKSYASR